MRTISDAVAGFALAKEEITVLSRAQALALIERACDRVLDSSSYFAALADRPGLHRAIQKSIDDLRHAAIDPSKIRTPVFEDRRKAADGVQSRRRFLRRQRHFVHHAMQGTERDDDFVDPRAPVIGIRRDELADHLPRPADPQFRPVAAAEWKNSAAAWPPHSRTTPYR